MRFRLYFFIGDLWKGEIIITRIYKKSQDQSGRSDGRHFNKRTLRKIRSGSLASFMVDEIKEHPTLFPPFLFK